MLTDRDIKGISRLLMTYEWALIDGRTAPSNGRDQEQCLYRAQNWLKTLPVTKAEQQDSGYFLGRDAAVAALGMIISGYDTVIHCL